MDTRECRACGERIVWTQAKRWEHVNEHAAAPVAVVRCEATETPHLEREDCQYPHYVSLREAELFWRAVIARKDTKSTDDVEGCDDCSRDGHECRKCGEPVSHGVRECESHGI